MSHKFFVLLNDYLCDEMTLWLITFKSKMASLVIFLHLMTSLDIHRCLLASADTSWHLLRSIDIFWWLLISPAISCHHFSSLFATTQLNSTQSWVSLIFLCKNHKPKPQTKNQNHKPSVTLSQLLHKQTRPNSVCNLISTQLEDSCTEQ